MLPFALFAIITGPLQIGYQGTETAKERVWFVSPKAGASGNGTKAKPFRNINEGIEAARITPGHDTVILLAGSHSLNAPIRLNGSDSNLTLRGEPGKRPVISGGTAIKQRTGQHHAHGNCPRVSPGGGPLCNSRLYGIQERICGPCKPHGQ